jgi:glycosyltransferase involved in cell wall biosynthesis
MVDSTMRCLAVLLCYNDGDLLPDSIRYLREQNHEIVLWDHGSTDDTAAIVAQMKHELLEVKTIPRSFDFYELYPAMSRHLMENYVRQYDWISWPDQDEFLEGPSRRLSYYESLREVYESSYDWIQFNNVNYWYTTADDFNVKSAPQRIRHYSVFPDCAPRIRSWRASATNIRVFNHNAPEGDRWPLNFNLRHYPMRSKQQALDRLYRYRAGLRRGDSNFHYENMARWEDRLEIKPEYLHFDDGQNELNLNPIFDWRKIYGYS